MVVGGSGFIGSAIQRLVLNEKLDDCFVFSHNKNRERIDPNLQTLHLDLLGDINPEVGEYQTVIYVAGNADHGLAKRSPLIDLDLNTRAFVNFMRVYRGKLVLLSSQAVYYDLEGEIAENVEHVSTMPYGISKQMTETYAQYFLKKSDLSQLWVIRLAYAYGNGEKKHRLIPRCANAVHRGTEVIIHGGGTSFVNPLPAEFLAKILLKAAEKPNRDKQGFLEIMNVNYPERVTVKDLISNLYLIRKFNFSVSDSGEEWPVRFWGNTQKLLRYTKDWNLEFPDLRDSLKSYFTELLQGRED